MRAAWKWRRHLPLFEVPSEENQGVETWKLCYKTADMNWISLKQIGLTQDHPSCSRGILLRGYVNTLKVRPYSGSRDGVGEAVTYTVTFCTVSESWRMKISDFLVQNRSASFSILHHPGFVWFSSSFAIGVRNLLIPTPQVWLEANFSSQYNRWIKR